MGCLKDGRIDEASILHTFDKTKYFVKSFFDF